MAGQIRTTPEQMRTRAGECRTNKAEFDDCVTKLRNIITALNDEWEGSAAQSYQSQFEQLEPSFRRTGELIDEMASQLDATANAYEELDTNIAGKFGVQ